MRFELLNDPGGHALSSSPGYIVTQHLLENGAFWTALSAGGPAPGQQRQGGSSLNSALWKPDCQLFRRTLASVETRMLSIH